MPGRGIRIRRSSGLRALTALVAKAANDCSTSPGPSQVAVIVHAPEKLPTVDEHLLRTWYDLTPAEARVAGMLATGLNLDAIVARLGVGANTVRTQLKSIFAKTNTNRQGELIALLLGNPTLGFPLPPDRFAVTYQDRIDADVVSKRSA